jgi:hypothetical protein
LGDSLEDAESLPNLLHGLLATRDGEQIQWTDMGGGWALAMREAASRSEFQDKINMTNVEVRDLTRAGAPDQYQIVYDYLCSRRNLREQIAVQSLVHILEDQYAPTFLRTDAETVDLGTSQDFISAVYSLQYFSNPLRAVCNWYNQLADHGILFLANDRIWEGGINQESNDGLVPAFTRKIFTDLREQGAQVATRNTGVPFRRMAFQKLPRTSLRLNVDVMSSRIRAQDQDNMRAVSYSRAVSDQPAIQLIKG